MIFILRDWETLQATRSKVIGYSSCKKLIPSQSSADSSLIKEGIRLPLCWGVEGLDFSRDFSWLPAVLWEEKPFLNSGREYFDSTF